VASSMAAVSLPAAAALPLDRLGFWTVGGVGGGGEPRVVCRWPPPSLYSAV
jgi:hypothetical protein